jgi:succinate dehydrogenase/fumarate reductase flavoprotein subunit
MKFVIIYTGGAGIAYPSGATEFITCFSGIRVAQQFYVTTKTLISIYFD